MKQLISLLLIILLLISFSDVAGAQYVEFNELYELLHRLTNSDMLTAGIMAYFYRESEYRVDAVGGWYLLPNENLCEDFVEKVDSGLSDGSSRQYFIETAHFVYGGFGLGQWSSFFYLERFYDFTQMKQLSIADLWLQCYFTVKGISENKELQNYLQECNTAYECGRLIAIYYDGASEYGVKYISNLAQEIYEKLQIDN